MDENLLLWRPTLFSVVGAGFTEKSNDGKPERVKPGVHLRCFSDPMLGMPGLGEKATLRVYPLQMGISIATQKNLAIWENSEMYKVRTQKKDPNCIERVAKPGKTIIRFMQRAREVFGGKDPRSTKNHLIEGEMIPYVGEIFNKLWRDYIVVKDGINSSYLYSDACAVDVQVNPFAGVSLDIPLQERKIVLATVRGYDGQGRMVAEDWIGEELVGFSLPGLPRTPSPHPRIKKDKAVLRAPGISRVEIEGRETIEIENIWWVFVQDYLENREIHTSDGYRGSFWHPEGFTWPAPKLTRLEENDLYAPFQPPLPDIRHLEDQIQQEKLFSIYQLLEKCSNTYQQWNLSESFSSQAALKGANDKQIQINGKVSYLSTLTVSALDPLIARVLGQYYYQDYSAAPLDVSKGDFLVAWYPRFFTESNLKELAIESSVDFRQAKLCGLVMGIDTITDKPLPRIQDPVAIENLKINPLKDSLMTSLQVTFPKDTVKVNPAWQAIGYRVKRGLEVDQGRFEFTDPAVDDALRSEINALLPPLVYPRSRKNQPDIIDDAKNSIERLPDFLTLKVEKEAVVQYELMAYDLFARAGECKTTSEVVITPPWLAPPSPTNGMAYIEQNNGNAVLNLQFGDPQPTTDKYQLKPEAVEIVIYMESEGSDCNKPSPGGLFLGEKIEIILATNATNWQHVNLQWEGQDPNLELHDTLLTLPLPDGYLTDIPTINSGQIDMGNGKLVAGHRITRNMRMVKSLREGTHRWCIRLRSRGTSGSGVTRYSPPLWIKAPLFVAPEPPKVESQKCDKIPVSTYPDRFGNSYFNIDLSKFIPLNKAANIYLARGDLLANIAEINPEEICVQLPGQARLKRHIFNLITPQPLEYTGKENQFYAIPVRGDLEKYFVAVVTGVSHYTEGEYPWTVESPWADASIVFFKTPKKMVFPELILEEASSVYTDGELTNTLRFSAQFDTEVTDLPYLQVKKMNETEGKNEVYLGKVPGEHRPDQPAGKYCFTITDADDLVSWRSYLYSVSLMVYSDNHGQFVKALVPIKKSLIAVGSGREETIKQIKFLQNADGTVALTIKMIPGEFNFSVITVWQNEIVSQISGKIIKGILTDVYGRTDEILELVKENGDFVLKLTRGGQRNIGGFFAVIELRSGNYRWKGRCIGNEPTN